MELAEANFYIGALEEIRFDSQNTAVIKDKNGDAAVVVYERGMVYLMEPVWRENPQEAATYPGTIIK